MGHGLSSLEKELSELREKGLYREFRTVRSHPGEWVTIDNKRLLNLSSNNYLALAGDLRIKRAAAAALEDCGFGATASRLVVGNYELYNRLEKEIADFKGTEAALVFNSGYAANLGIIQALIGRGDMVVSDRLNHASIIDGIVLSRAEHRRYKHRDMASLEKILKTSGAFRRKLIITDSIFSMDGDLAPLKEIAQLKHKYGALLMLDEAHGCGVFGDKGRGLAEAAGVSGAVDIHMGTFSKAFGGMGAYAAGTGTLIEYLRNKSRSLIYTTALPPVVVGGLLEALRIIREESWRRENLLAKAEKLRNALRQQGFDTLHSQSQIIPVVIGSARKTLEFSLRLFARSIFAPAVRPPTVPADTARIRLALMATHSDDDLETALQKMAQTGYELGVI